MINRAPISSTNGDLSSESFGQGLRTKTLGREGAREESGSLRRYESGTVKRGESGPRLGVAALVNDMAKVSALLTPEEEQRLALGIQRAQGALEGTLTKLWPVLSSVCNNNRITKGKDARTDPTWHARLRQLDATLTSLCARLDQKGRNGGFFERAEAETSFLCRRYMAASPGEKVFGIEQRAKLLGELQALHDDWQLLSTRIEAACAARKISAVRLFALLAPLDPARRDGTSSTPTAAAQPHHVVSPELFELHAAMIAWQQRAGMPFKKFAPLWDLLTRQREQLKELEQSFANANLRLLLNRAARWPDHSLGVEECVSEGAIGLMTGTDGFDHRRGFKFSTYATRSIDTKISRGIAAWSGRSQYSVAEQAHHRTVGTLRAMLGREPTEAEFARHAGLGEEEAARALRKIRKRPTTTTFSDCAPCEERNFEPPVEAEGVQPDQLAIDAEHRKLLHLGMELLDEQEMQVLSLRYPLGEHEEPLTLEEAGIRLGMTREWVRQIQKRALEKLRSFICEADRHDPNEI